MLPLQDVVVVSLQPTVPDKEGDSQCGRFPTAMSF